MFFPLSLFLLQVYDGPSTHFRLIGTYCGTAPSSFTSSGSSVTIQFISDFSINGRGFLLDWYAMEAPTDVGHSIPVGVSPIHIVSRFHSTPDRIQIFTI